MLIRLIGDLLVAEKETPDPCLMSQIFGKIRLDAAFGRVDLQSRENGQALRLLPALFAQHLRGCLVIGQNAPAQGGIGDLPDAGGKGAFHCLEAGAPVVGVCDQRLGGRDLQQRQIMLVLQPLAVIVSEDAAAEHGFSIQVDSIPVIVRAA